MATVRLTFITIYFTNLNGYINLPFSEITLKSGFKSVTLSMNHKILWKGMSERPIVGTESLQIRPLPPDGKEL